MKNAENLKIVNCFPDFFPITAAAFQEGSINGIHRVGEQSRLYHCYRVTITINTRTTEPNAASRVTDRVGKCLLVRNRDWGK